MPAVKIARVHGGSVRDRRTDIPFSMSAINAIIGP